MAKAGIKATTASPIRRILTPNKYLFISGETLDFLFLDPNEITT